MTLLSVCIHIGYARPQYLFLNITAACIPPGYTNWQHTSDEYHPESDNSSDSDGSLLPASFRKSERVKMKETRLSNQAENETIENESISARKSCSTIHITETIEDVIAQFRLDDTSPPIGYPIWRPVRSNNLKHFPFTEPNPGVKAEIY
ncbi:hypothetical protein JTB14_018459 [Gonioctena quinquepunctata]|nr:hypothetical protein JTB14_018459 [Gonioctena quinquepunctata]